MVLPFAPSHRRLATSARTRIRALFASLLLVGIAPAMASTLKPTTLAERRDAADLIVEATVASVEAIVLDDGYPITEYELSVTRTIGGVLRTDAAERLRLPGGMKDGVLMAEGSPQLAVGATLLLVGRRDRVGTLLLVSGKPSLFIADELDTSTAVATDADGNPVVEVDCLLGVTIARPADQAPADIAAAGLDRVFVDDPRAVGLPWTRFTDRMAACLTTDGGAR